mgnify:CR=1 FL=1
MSTVETTTTALTPEITKAQITLSLNKEGLAYQNLLQECEDVKFTNDNLNEKRDCLINLRKVKSKLAAMENPFTERWKGWNASKKSLADPVDELLSRKEAEFKKKADENAAAAKKIEDEKIRVKGIKDAIDTFFLEQSQAVANTSDPSEIVRIEKLVGSHRANRSKYQEFLHILNQKADELAPLIKMQKESLRKLNSLEEAENSATDDQDILDIMEEREGIEKSVAEMYTHIQESTLKMATSPDIAEVDIVASEAPKPRRTTWDFDIPDINNLLKKAPELVLITPDKEKIKEILRKKIADGETKNTEEILYLNGAVRFYLHKTY